MIENVISAKIMINGLSKEEVLERIQDNKINKSASKITRTYKEIIYSNLFTYFNLINCVLFGLIILVNSYKNGLFFGIVLTNAAIGIFQEIRSKRTLDKLAVLTINKVDVYRDQKLISIPVNEIVLDDLIVCREGTQVPSDCVIVSGIVEVNESILTGESKPNVKTKDSELFSGSFITSSEVICKVIHVGSDNYSERIINEAKKYKKHTSQLENSINKILKIVSIIIIPMGLLLFLSQYFILNMGLENSVVKTVGALVGMIPEGLVFLTSIALAVSVLNLAKKRTLVQELFCVETLARVDILCLDKTGTITEGIMKVQDKVLFNPCDLDEIVGNFCSVFPSGNSTNQALCQSFDKKDNYVVQATLPFSSERKFSAVQYENKGTYYFGAAQFLFLEENEELSTVCQKYASEGYRVVVIAHSNEAIVTSGTPTHLELLACLMISDTIRSTAAETLKYFNKQGVILKIISGDDPLTVSAIARKVGMENADSYVDVSKLSDSELKESIFTKSIFGRVTPIQKKAMVAYLQEGGHIVAMTGDGVNDVPALKKADVSIAMATGSDAAKNTANIVLLDSDFSCLPNVVNEGRRVINNICRASSMFLIKTVFSVCLSLISIILLDTYPFQPIQLTVIGMFSIGIPTFLLQFEPSYQRVQGNFLREAFRNAVPVALTIALGVFAMMIITRTFGLSSLELTTFATIQTGIIYTMALYRVYSPLTKYRLIVIIMMQLLLFISLVFGHELLSIQLLNPLLMVLIVSYSIISIGLVKILTGVFIRFERLIFK